MNSPTSVITAMLLSAAILIPGSVSVAQDEPYQAAEPQTSPEKTDLPGDRHMKALTASSSSLPLRMSYQGLLTNIGGGFVADGPYDLTIELYDSLAGGSLQWTESHAGVPVQLGTFGITLGVTTPLNLQFNIPLFLQVTATGGPAGPAYPLTFSPRSELTSAPYSLAPWVTTDSNISYNNGSVGIGTSTPGLNGIPSLRLEIADEEGLNSDIGMRVAGNTGGYPVFNFGKSRGTLAAPAITATGDILGQLRFAGWDGSIYRGAAHILAFVDSTPAAGRVPGRLSFYTQSSGPGSSERMRLDRNGYLGIGLFNPQYRLDVLGPRMRLLSPLGTDGAFLILNHQGESPNTRTWLVGSAGSGNSAGRGKFTIYDDNVDLDRMVIDTLGRVGFGMTSPLSPMVLQGSSSWGTMELAGTGTDVEASIGFHSTNVVKGGLGYYVLGVNNNAGPASAFSLYVANGLGAGSQAITVTTNGNVGIGTGVIAPAARLHVNGSAGNNTGVWSFLSDRRLKEEIEPIRDALSIVDRLRGVTFRWKDGEKDAQYGRVRGLIAQDVEEVIPEWVKTGPDGYKRLEPIGAEALLIEAIKEQQQQIAEQARRLDAQALQMNELRKALEALAGLKGAGGNSGIGELK